MIVMDFGENLKSMAKAAYATGAPEAEFEHAERVAKVAGRFQEQLGGDLAVIQAAALFHHVEGGDEDPLNADKSGQRAKAILLDAHLD